MSDELASKDAANLYRFLQRRGFIAGDAGPLPNLLREASPLTAVDMIEAEKVGIVVWRVNVGDEVKEGHLLGEIVDIGNVDAARLPILARNNGIVFARKLQKYVRSGQIIIKIAGFDPLPWRVDCDSLLTS